MADFEIFTDSCCDLPKELVEQCKIQVMQLEVNIDGNPPVLNRDIESKVFYEQLRKGANAKTSAITPGCVEENMRKSLEEGKDIIYIGFSSGLSATYMAGKNAAEEISEKYPDVKILTVDSLCAALGQGLLIKYAVDKKNEGATVEELAAYVQETYDFVDAEVYNGGQPLYYYYIGVE